jgi:hypothetical protein
MAGVAVTSARLTVAQPMDANSTRQAERVFTGALLKRECEAGDFAAARRRLEAIENYVRRVWVFRLNGFGREV